MNRRNVVRLALAAALFGAAIPGAALAQDQWMPDSRQAQQNGGDQRQAQQYGSWAAGSRRHQPMQRDSRDRGQQQPMQRRSWDRYQFHPRDLFEGRWMARDRFDTNGRGGFGQGWNRGDQAARHQGSAWESTRRDGHRRDRTPDDDPR